LQGDQSLSDGRAANSEARLQVAFRWKAIPRPQLSLQDLALEVRCDLLKELSALYDNRFGHLTFHAIMLDSHHAKAIASVTNIDKHRKHGAREDTLHWCFRTVRFPANDFRQPPATEPARTGSAGA
jgi:hypothetical protein